MEEANESKYKINMGNFLLWATLMLQFVKWEQVGSEDVLKPQTHHTEQVHSMLMTYLTLLPWCWLWNENGNAQHQHTVYSTSCTAASNKPIITLLKFVKRCKVTDKRMYHSIILSDFATNVVQKVKCSQMSTNMRGLPSTMSLVHCDCNSDIWWRQAVKDSPTFI